MPAGRPEGSFDYGIQLVVCYLLLLETPYTSPVFNGLQDLVY